jgi:hypothetical protein
MPAVCNTWETYLGIWRMDDVLHNEEFRDLWAHKSSNVAMAVEPVSL